MPAPDGPRPPLADRPGDRRGPRARVVRHDLRRRGARRAAPGSGRRPDLRPRPRWASGPTAISCRSSRAAPRSPRTSSRSAIPAPTHIEPHLPRVTFNPSILAATPAILVMVGGAAKAEIVARILDGPRLDPAAPDGLPGPAGAADARRDLAPRRRSGSPAATAIVIEQAAPAGFVESPDGTPIAWWEESPGTARSSDPRPTLILVHGATADHTAFRAVAPALRRVPPGDLDRPPRPGRERRSTCPTRSSASTRTSRRWSTSWLPRPAGPVDVVGHSFGGRCGLGAALLTKNLRRLVVYEGAPAPAGRAFQDEALLARARRARARPATTTGSWPRS